MVECPVDTHYDCSQLVPAGCTISGGFDFLNLQQLVRNINCSNPLDPRLVHPKLANGIAYTALTHDACKQISGSYFTWYPLSDVWSRLTSWKFPLFQLAAIFPRPPLSWTIQFFVVFHLLGNPIGTAQDLIVKIASCQSRALYWKCRFSDDALLLHWIEGRTEMEKFQDLERKWKAFAIIIDSFDEWGRTTGSNAREMLENQLMYTRPDHAPTELSITTSNRTDAVVPRNEDPHTQFMRACLLAADALAADRATNFLPVIVAQILFVSSVALAVSRSSAAGPNSPTIFINVEAHSISFSATYFWMLPLVILGAIIGASQSERAIYRILNRFKKELRQIDFSASPPPANILQNWDKSLEDWSRFLGDWDRFLNYDQAIFGRRLQDGGVYSWQPDKWYHWHPHRLTYTPSIDVTETKLDISTSRERLGRRPKTNLSGLLSIQPGSPVMPLFIVTIGYFTACAISWDVPPYGWNCRHIGETLMYVVWLAAWIADFSISRGDRLFAVCLVKDTFVALLNIIAVLITQFGVFNSCGCYTLWGKVPVALPQLPPWGDILHSKMQLDYPAAAYSCIALSLIIIPIIIIWQYIEAMQTFLQRDDSRSNHPILQRWRSDSARYGFWSAALVRIYPPVRHRLERNVSSAWEELLPYRGNSIVEAMMDAPNVQTSDAHVRDASGSSSAPLIEDPEAEPEMDLPAVDEDIVLPPRGHRRPSRVSTDPMTATELREYVMEKKRV